MLRKDHSDYSLSTERKREEKTRNEKTRAEEGKENQTSAGDLDRGNGRRNELHEVEEVLLWLQLPPLRLLVVDHRLHGHRVLARVNGGSWNSKMWMWINGGGLFRVFLLEETKQTEKRSDEKKENVEEKNMDGNLAHVLKDLILREESFTILDRDMERIENAGREG
jgi:hypothetical protein